LTKALDLRLAHLTEARAENSQLLGAAMSRTAPNTRVGRHFYDFFGENSDGIFDGISQNQLKIPSKIKTRGT
jgi:hypothetical protein